MAAIFLIEDDFSLRRDLGIMLKKEGFSVFPAADLKEARQLFISSGPFSLVLLDKWLPDGDGFELLDMIRKTSGIPVLFLTACDDEASVIRGLELGADDYITKPFRRAELIARIRANLRRTEPVSALRKLESEGLIMDLDVHEVRKDGKTIGLRPAEFRLLKLFMENPGILLSRERILSLLQEETLGDPPEDNTLSVYISRLRQQIGRGYIETERSFGYRFSKNVQRINT